ncbi:MAG TPA: hypothetical protein VFZ83_03945 [Acidimicrobiia bacterium]|nr:hypothetical protein [Acidimicrobiia bacterium]
MPWCTACDRYLAAPTVRTDGTCPTCGRAVDTSSVIARPQDDLPPVPWHFKAFLAAFAVYLGWRFFEMLDWLL